MEVSSSLSDRPCRNCGLIHGIVPGAYSTDCLILCDQKHTRPSQSNSSQHHGTLLLLPTSIREQALLFDDIWFRFVDVKHENADLRHRVRSLSAARGELRQQAPIPWLRWTRIDGSSGKTRNQENYEKLWKTFVHTTEEDGQKVPVAWLTICATLSCK